MVKFPKSKVFSVHFKILPNIRFIRQVMTVGYARVSTPNQNISSQINLLKENGCESIYTDIPSDVREDRKGLSELLSFLRKGDTIIVYKTDRIFRSLKI